MKHHLVILSLVFYLGGITLAHATHAFCPSDSSTVSVLLAKEGDDKKDGGKKGGEEKNPEDDCE
jgi:hypothetical protein